MQVTYASTCSIFPVTHDSFLRSTVVYLPSKLCTKQTRPLNKKYFSRFDTSAIYESMTTTNTRPLIKVQLRESMIIRGIAVVSADIHRCYAIGASSIRALVGSSVYSWVWNSKIIFDYSVDYYSCHSTAERKISMIR